MMIKSEKKIKKYLNVLVGSVILTILGFIADLSTVFTSTWFQFILKSNVVQFIPYVLLIILTGLLLYLYQMVKNKSSEANDAYNVNNQLWKRTIRTLRSIILEDLPTPTIRESLDPILDELAKRLPDNGTDFKISIAKPLINGEFKILASRGTDPTSVHLLESRSNWKNKKSFFSNALLLDEDHPFCKYKSGGANYENIQKPTGIGTAKYHFTVVIKNNRYKDKCFPHNTLAVISIGIPPKYSFDDTEDEAFYNSIYPTIRCVEAIFLLDLKISLNK